MLEAIIKTIFGDIDAKKIKKYQKDVLSIRKLHQEFESKTLEEIQTRNKQIIESFSWLDFLNSEDSKKIKTLLEECKYEAVAMWLRTCDILYGQNFELENGQNITWMMKPYDVQIIGGLAIHDAHVAEMKTGEGKTLVATLPAYLNALTGNSVHVVTVNDYLARRDALEMGILYKALWLSVGVISHGQSRTTKKENYAKHIIYATNNELGFDYLRDNMAISEENQVMGKRFFAIIDEVDSILIDEARTPLIISMPDAEPTGKYLAFAKLAKDLVKGSDYKIDEKGKTAPLTEAGIKKIEKMLGIENIYVSERYNDLHHIENAIKASSVYLKDKDYIIRDEQIMIVDEHTGRVLPGRRYSDGLHQALEAKEGVPIQQESKTLASITFQNYFRMYWKLAGMTGTAKTEEEEFYKVYSLETLVVPTNKPIARQDLPDLLFKNEKGKFEYVVNYISELHQSGRPILVGTVSVEKSEYLSARLSEKGIPHNVLNAKQHEKEAEIVAAAGQLWAVTIATNMAGRGTDIKLWEGVKELGWLIILGTEKHETRRIDNQLRGRAGRQWDPGMTQFLISPNDDIMRIFGGDKLFGVFNSPMFASLPDNEPLTQSKMLTNKVLWVQKQVEGHHFDSRKHVLEYDDVMNKHREIIYGRRAKLLAASTDTQYLEEKAKSMIYEKVKSFILWVETKNQILSKEKLVESLHFFLGRKCIDDLLEIEDVSALHGEEPLSDYIAKRAVAEFEVIKSEAPSPEAFYELLKRIFLQSIDRLWMNHIDAMSKLREQVAFVGYAQKQPLMVYKEEAFKKFENLLAEIELRTVKSIFSIKVTTQVEIQAVDESKLEEQGADIDAMKMGDGILPTANPLFVQPSQNSSVQKQKIRV